MLQLSDVSVAYEGEFVFTGVTLQVSRGERVGLVGANGSGKTSLLRVISGEQAPTGGTISSPSTWRIAYLPQDSYVVSDRTLHDEMLSVFEDVLGVEERQREVERRMAHASGEELSALLEEYGRLQADFDRLEGYTIEREVGTILHGLGFTPNDSGRLVRHFSGGWQSRIALARALLRHPDLLLLDEPTNHLDLSAVEWLEDFLSSHSGAVIVVSHDRYFLDRVTQRTLELERGTLTDYPGRYSWYVGEKERRREAQQEAYERQQRELARQQEFIDRFRAKASKAASVKSREKMLERMDRVESPEPELRRVKFRFPFKGNSGREALKLKDASRRYGDREALKNVSLLVERGDKIGVVGENGSGKSTLLRLLAGLDKPTSGQVHIGHNVVVAYYDQHQAELLDKEHSVYEEIMAAAPRDWTVTDVRTLLGRFLFTGDDVSKPISVLSGGERSRVALVKMLLKPANTLLLDEPTNHLDIPTRDVLEQAIRDYPGTCVVVSHDRYFLDRIASKTVEMDRGRATLYLGNYTYYRERRRGQDQRDTGPRPAEPRREGAERQRRTDTDPRRLRQEIEALEAEIEQTEARLDDVQGILNDPDLYEDMDRYNSVLAEYGELQGRLQGLNDRWERKTHHLDQLQPPPKPAANEVQRDRMVDRLRELDALLEDPDAYTDQQRARSLMDEYAEIYEELAGQGAVGKPRAAPEQRAREQSRESVQSIEARLAEIERALMDPTLFVDESRSGPLIEEYDYLRGRLDALTRRGTGDE